MALQMIGNQGSNYITASKMLDGEKVEGYLLGFKAGKFEGSEKIVLQRKTGGQIEVNSSGSLRYIRQDAEKAGHKILTGAFTVITKISSYKTKSGKTSARFTFEQDSEDTIQVTSAQTAEAAIETIEERLAKKKKMA